MFEQPDGRLNDFEQTFTVGDTLGIKWKAGWEGSETQPDFVDLFVCWFDSDSYSQLLIANTTTKQAGFYPWTINVTDAAVKDDDKFVLRFRPHRDPEDYNNAGPMAPSRGFYIKLASTSSSPSPTPTPTPSSTSSTVVSATTTPTSTPAPEPEKKSTNVGAIVGGVVGGLAVIALCVIAWLLMRLLRRRKAKVVEAYEVAAPIVPYSDGYGADKFAARIEPPKYPGSNITMELDGRELPVEAGSGQGR
ncbi:hypothetical protein K458DRAFT_423225 [Lentithecium fluviatile CBS 122367]|uniref:Mid2 domain-containing protein n=1 Tax=Lentithecium fluviatile CBS 122367 TaxID=1168545 RepID=A0A6G1IJ83_9PLEO|nr:hypothetical protein K458DRAFT_423225 [Lentithecium fluviatile CBS 122367]